MSRYKKIKLKDGSTVDQHRLIWENEYGEIPSGMVVHHVNGIKDDNRTENLSLMTQAEHNRLHFKKDDKDRVHGNSGYRNGCRCSVCRRWKSDTQHRWRRERIQSDVPHGTNNGYVHYRCRCGACRAAHSDANKKKRLRP